MFNPEGFSTQLPDTEAPPLTAQSLFDTTLTRLVAQGRPSIYRGVCQYHRGSLRCAVGLHILEHEYSPEMEGDGVTNLINHDQLPERLIPFHDLLASMQSAHDGAGMEYFLPIFLHTMEGVAMAHDLNRDTVRALRFAIGDIPLAQEEESL